MRQKVLIMTQGSRNYHIGNPNDVKHGQSFFHVIHQKMVSWLGSSRNRRNCPATVLLETIEKSRWIGLISTSIPQTRLQRMELMSTS